MNSIATADFGGDYRQHPDSTIDPPVDEEIVPDTGVCGNFTQPVYECELCGSWSMDPRPYVKITVSNRTGYQCKNFDRCTRNQARKAGRAS